MPHKPVQTESELIAAARQGDAQALSELLGRHGLSVRRCIAGTIPRRWRSVLSADDVMQQAYASAFLSIHRFEDKAPGGFRRWLDTLARRNLRDAVKMLSRQKRGGDRHGVPFSTLEDSVVALYQALTSASHTPSRVAARHEALEAMHRALSLLPGLYRKVVQRLDLEGQPIEDVAAAVDRSVGAVYMIRARAHDRLAELMGAVSRFF